MIRQLAGGHDRHGNVRDRELHLRVYKHDRSRHRDLLAEVPLGDPSLHARGFHFRIEIRSAKPRLPKDLLEPAPARTVLPALSLC